MVGGDVETYIVARGQCRFYVESDVPFGVQHGLRCGADVGAIGTRYGGGVVQLQAVFDGTDGGYRELVEGALPRGIGGQIAVQKVIVELCRQCSRKK